ncbi:MAG: ParB family transcriptional regulator, chromosome partitioning protein [Pseudonocardiales bacterium]|nr:ParB family transcriptional regulator, chromosome partitioning protein [Pseudonocardiales bacterium]
MSERNKPRRGGLGRGLGALIPTSSEGGGASPTDVYFGPAPTAPASAADGAAADGTAADGTAASTDQQASSSDNGPLPVPGASFAELPISAIHPNAKQPRQVFDEDALAELTHSIREFGVLQPVVVRPDTDGYELVMGERRLRAATAAGLDTVPAIVRSTGDDAMLRDALLENIHRAQLNPLEEAAAYQQLLEEFGTTHEELAQRIGRSRPQVSNTIRLLNLPVPVQRRVAAGVLSAGHARALLGLEDADEQDVLATRIVAEGLSVRATEELVALALSGHAATPKLRRAAAPRISAPGVTELGEKLSDAFDTRVRVEIGRRKGRITVEFASVDDLERIVALMAPQLATPSAQPVESNEP